MRCSLRSPWMLMSTALQQALRKNGRFLQEALQDEAIGSSIEVPRASNTP